MKHLLILFILNIIIKNTVLHNYWFQKCQAKVKTIISEFFPQLRIIKEEVRVSRTVVNSPSKSVIFSKASYTLRAGPTRLCVPVCNHDAASSKHSSVGRHVVDIHQQTKCDCVVNVCGSKRCKTCKHVHE